MNLLLALALPWRLAGLFVLGAFVGGQLNRGIYRLAWHPRSIGPWSRPLDDAPPRRTIDRLPIAGWIFARRESHLHGAGFWIRPLLIELCTASGFAALYWWEIRGGLLPDVQGLLPPTPAAIHAQYLAHIVLISLMIIATFIDFDEKTIPDAVTVPGTVLALVLMTAIPASQLPIVARLGGAWSPVHLSVTSSTTSPSWADGLGGPASWPAWLDGTSGLWLGLAAFVAWCYAIQPKLWTTRHGISKAFRYLAVSMFRYDGWWIVPVLCLLGGTGITAMWWHGGLWWQSLFSSLVGMAFGGGLIWAVRIVGSGALRKEAMGFGDVTLMALIGAFLGWQSAFVVFFLAPFAALFISLSQWILTGRKDIAFGPYLCLGALALIVAWAHIWSQWGRGIFSLGWFIPLTVAVCLVLMAGMLSCWRIAADLIFPMPEEANDTTDVSNTTEGTEDTERTEIDLT